MSYPAYRRTNLVLPALVHERFAAISHNTENATVKRNIYIVSLKQAGWTASAIAQASGLTRERVRQIAAKGYPEDVTGSTDFVPTPPEKIVRTPAVYVEPDPVVLARLLELQPMAEQVRGPSDKYRAEGAEYTRLINEQVEAGVKVYRLAKRLNRTHTAISLRLTRYGYRSAPEGSTSKSYALIRQTAENPQSED